MSWIVPGLVTAVAAYAVGTFPTAQLVGRRIGADPTTEGSGNPGATNVYRLGGRRAGVAVFVIDALKGALPTAVALAASGRPLAHVAWVAATLGHVWPVTRGLRGGKGVATAGGGGLVISPVIGLASALAFVVVARLTRIAAAGSLAIAVTFPTLSLLVGRPAWEVATSAGLAAVLVVRHRSNIGRILRREEDRLGRDRAG